MNKSMDLSLPGVLNLSKTKEAWFSSTLYMFTQKWSRLPQGKKFVRDKIIVYFYPQKVKKLFEQKINFAKS